MKKHSIGRSESLGTSPSTDHHRHHQDKGWSSERVPHPTTSTNTTNRRRSRRHTNSTTLTPPFYNGSRTQLPSKWEDAERWITCSPVVGYGVAKNTTCSYSQQRRRPKSTSGPILAPGIVSSFESGGGGGSSFLGNGSSPFTTGVFMGYGVGVGQLENVASCSTLLGWTHLLTHSSLPNSTDEKLEDTNAAENSVTRVISRRDMATQMSPWSSSNSSSGIGSSSPPTILPIVELESDQNAKLDIREVQVDKRATNVSWSTRHGSCLTTKALPNVDDCNRHLRDRCSWDISEAVSDFSKLQREEAKITAWENLQKAKAEAAIRKLEMKLEKKRSSSIEKILNKLKIAQSKAQQMRSSMTIGDDLKTKRLQMITCSRKSSRFCSLQSCFTWQHFEF